MSETSTWADLESAIKDATSLDDFAIRYSYPPRELDTTMFNPDTTLSHIAAILCTNLDGEQLTLVPRMSPATSAPLSLTRKQPVSSSTSSSSSSAPGPGPRASVNDPPELPLPDLDGTLVLRVMPDDNSCLFRALGSAILSSAFFEAEASAAELRSIVASTIQSDTTGLYSSAVLDGKSADVYCSWIQDPDSWGGGIELSILSLYFDVEIASINVQDGRVDWFNQGKERRVVLVYSGIHYDVVALVLQGSVAAADVGQEAVEKRVFEVLRFDDHQEESSESNEGEDGGVLEKARELCTILRRRHYYTDTKAFSIRCGTCGWMGKGEKAATGHAQETGHTDFGEA